MGSSPDQTFGDRFDAKAVLNAALAEWGWLQPDEWHTLVEARFYFEYEYLSKQVSNSLEEYQAFIDRLNDDWDEFVAGQSGTETALLDRAISGTEPEWLEMRRHVLSEILKRPWRLIVSSDLLGLAMVQHGADMMAIGPHALPSFCSSPARAIRRGPVVTPTRGPAGPLRSRMGSPPAGMKNPQAHHDLPKAFRDQFQRAGLDIDNPAFGRWVQGTPPGGHQKWSYEFNKEWQAFFRKNPNATQQQILDKMNQLRSDPRFQ